MVVGLALAAVQMGMALPTGFLFGVGYGTGVRIGYEQVYPLLFPKGARPTTSELAATMKGMNKVYDAIGGKDASRMGIAVGITNAGEILNNPDFQVLNQLESSSSGLTSSSSTRSRYGLDQESPLPDPSSKTGLDTSYFNTFYLAIQTFNLTQTISAYGEATQYRNGFSKQQNNEFLIPALRTRLSFLRSPDSVKQPIVNTVPTSTPAPYRDATAAEKEFNIWRNTLHELQTKYRRHQLEIERQQLHKLTNTSTGKLSQRLFDETRAKIRRIANDYRNPNNTIRKEVLKLRQDIANGNWV